MKFSLDDRDQPTERLSAYDDGESSVQRADADSGGGLVTLAFLRAALRRKAKLWCVLAVVGLALGLGALKVRPGPDQASTSILLPPSSYPNEIADDQAILQTHAVAEIAVRKLGLTESADTFLHDYTSTTPSASSTRVLVITADATSSAQAVRNANLIASAFLTFQAELLKIEGQLVTSSIGQQVAQAQQHVAALSNQITQVSLQPASPARDSELASLRAQQEQASNALTVLQQTDTTNEATTQISTASILDGSRVLDPALPVPQHTKKRMLLWGGGGLLAGLVAGLAIVILGALMSSRLRQRDDIARVLGAPVRLSVGKVRLSGSSRRRGLEAAGIPQVRQIVSYLSSAVSARSSPPASLAVVPVDDLQLPALCLASLALSCAKRDMRVVVADLCTGAPTARLLGVADPGVTWINVDRARLAVVIPGPDEVIPVGPLLRESPRGEVSEALMRAFDASDLVLTLSVVDPSLGADHLSGWATSAVVVVTAGQATATRLHAVGELLRVAGLKFSAVLVGADETDESLGLTRIRLDSAREVTANGHHSENRDLLVTFDSAADGAPSSER
ncbi:MAG: hypothetical protein ACRDOK_01245 [Streptosporangiaceae bacterium]